MVDFKSGGMIISALVIFLYSLVILGDTLKVLFNEKARGYILKYTANPFIGFIIGIVVSVLLHSSSATVALAIIFASASIITYKRAIIITLGANIGTTISSVIIIFDFSLILPFIFLLGLIFILFSKQNKVIGTFLFHFALLLFGLDLFSSAISSIANIDNVTSLISSIDQVHIFGVLIGALVVGVIQSSTIFLAILQSLFTSAKLQIGAIISLILGANIGTCLDGFLAGNTKIGRKIAFFNLYFNLAGAVIFLIIINPFSSLIILLSSLLSLSSGATIILIHFLFNLITSISGLLLVIYFIKD